MECRRVSFTAPPGKGEGAVFDVRGLLSYLETLTDSRCRKGKRYGLAWVLLFIALAKLGGEDRPSGIADWVAERQEELLEFLQLPYPRTPHHNTYRRIMAKVVKPEELDEKISQ